MKLENTGQEIFDALKECSWIELEDGIVVIPEWSKKTGQTLEKLEKNRDYKRARKGD